MAKVTSKLQVTIPKALAEAAGVEPGDDIDWSASGDILHLRPARREAISTVAKRLEIFDRATARQREREARSRRRATPSERGWTREDLYHRGRSD
jgi:AbrB family looped-hinge helix DNA binding protein